MDVGAYEAKTHLAQLLERVAAGETVTITRHGKAVARLVPTGAGTRRDTRTVVAGMRRRRRGRTLGLPIQDLIREGRR